MILLVIFCSILLCVNSLSSDCQKDKPILCDFDDAVCVSRASNTVYSKVVEGIPGVMEPMDPLKLEKLDISNSSFQYNANDIVVYGLRNCTVKELALKAAEELYTYHVLCPKLQIETKSYNTSGINNGIHFKGAGKSTITNENSTIILKGHYSKFLDDANELHTHIVDYVLQYNAEYIDCNFEELLISTNNGDDWKLASQEHQQKLDELIRDTLIDKIMVKFLDSHDKILKTIPVTKILVQNLNLSCL